MGYVFSLTPGLLRSRSMSTSPLPDVSKVPALPSRRAVLLVLLCVSMVGPFSTNMYLPSMSDMTQVFGVGVSTVQSTVSVYALGLAVGVLFYGPLSDRFGRRPILLTSLVIYFVASVACALANSIDVLIAARFIQAIGACGGGNIGRAIVRDAFSRTEISRVLSYMASAVAIAPAVAPIIGGYLHLNFGWYASFVVMAAFGATLFSLSFAVLKETNRHKNSQATHLAYISRNARSLLGDRTYLANAMVIGLTFGAMFSYTSNSSFIFIDILKLDAADYGHTFMVVAACYLAGALLGARFSPLWGPRRMVTIGLTVSILFTSVAAGLAAAGIQTVWTVLPFAGAQFFACALVQPNGQAGAITPYPRMAGTASSLLGFSQMVFGATVSYLVSVMFEGTTRPLMYTMVTCSLLALVIWLTVLPGKPNACRGKPDEGKATDALPPVLWEPRKKAERP